MTRGGPKGQGVERLLSAVVEGVAVLSCVLCAVMMLHVVADIVARYVFNAPFLGTIEIVSGYYMVALAFLPLACVVKHEGHIFVELFTRHLARRTVLRLDIMVALVTFVVLAAFAWITADEAVNRSIQGEVWDVSDGIMIIWPSRWYLPIGCGLMAGYVLVRLLRGSPR